jgi:dephospho-CoA kinase
VMNYILIGRMGAGKDTVASMLEGRKPVAFASELKRLATTLRSEGAEKTYAYAKTLFDEEPEDLLVALHTFAKTTKDSVKDRRLLQSLGTDYCRKHDPNIWIKALKRRMEPNENYVITDCRFPNEFNAFPDFVSVHLVCDDENRHSRISLRDGVARDPVMEGIRDNHESEKYVDALAERCVLWLDTSCGLEELRSRVKNMDLEVERMLLARAV